MKLSIARRSAPLAPGPPPPTLSVGLAALVCGGMALLALMPTSASGAQAGGEVKTYTFDSQEAVAGWTLTGDVTVDAAKGREGKGGAIEIGPGGQAVLRFRNRDRSGKVELWVYDDGTVPQDPKASRVGPRWGIVESDGKLLAVGVLYASYLGGDVGYTASNYDGGNWFNQLFWLGLNRAPAGWHKWTIVFDPEKGIHLFHCAALRAAGPQAPGGEINDGEVDAGHFDNTKAGLRGFNAISIWGDSGAGAGQTIWVDDVSITAGGPVKSVPVAAPRVEGPSLWVPSGQQVVMYTRDRPPATPKSEDLPLRQKVSQYGITWTFERPARVGQFVNGDWYVVGPVTITAIDPRPLYGAEIPEIEFDHMDLERAVDERVRNGFMVNPPPAMQVAYDSGVRNWFDPSLIQKLPVAMKPGDSLVSTISMPKGLVLKAQLRNEIERGVEDSSPIRTAAVLTCLGEPQPPDAFRPAFCDREHRIYLARDLKRELLPTASATKSAPDVALYARFTQRPWVGTGFFGFEEPVENMPQYGLEYGRVSGISALLLCTDLKPEQKETLLVNFVQVGIDLGGMVRAGHPGWTGFGGHGSGRKLPIVFAGLLLGDEQLANVNRSFPDLSFGEDEQTAYGDCWTGAKVVFAGHSGIDVITGEGRSRGNGWGPYEHMSPTEWKRGELTSESYRRCCTSIGWVAQALALHLMSAARASGPAAPSAAPMKAERAWNHGAFFDYVDRWMYEDDAQFVKTIKEATGQDFSPDWARQGQAWDDFVNEMWAAHRTDPGMAPTNGWKQEHDDSYYRYAVAHTQR